MMNLLVDDMFLNKEKNKSYELMIEGLIQSKVNSYNEFEFEIIPKYNQNQVDMFIKNENQITSFKI